MPRPAFLFDLDGTLVDSVYQHVIAWQEALADCGIPLSVWRIHRRIGMSGSLFLNALQRETGVDPGRRTTLTRVAARHAERYLARAGPGGGPARGPGAARSTCTSAASPSPSPPAATIRTAAHAIALLDLPDGTVVVTRDQVERAKPDPDLFLAAADRSGVDPRRCFVVGDSIWDLLAAQRAGSLGIGLLSGGYGREELQDAGAYRVYADPAEMADHLEEVGVRPNV